MTPLFNAMVALEESAELIAFYPCAVIKAETYIVVKFEAATEAIS